MAWYDRYDFERWFTQCAAQENEMPDNAANILKSGMQGSAGSHAEAEGRNRRQEMRLPCDPGDVRLELDGSPEPVEGHIVEVSKSGFQLRLGTVVPVGESVRVIGANTVISGEIRYCRANDEGSFDTGVAILDFQPMQ
jgi:hypothetical protein